MDAFRDLLLNPSSAGEKLLVMLIAIALFVAVMAIVLAVIELPKGAPQWLIFIGFTGPAFLLIAFGLIYPGLVTIRQAFFDRTSDNFIGLDNFGVIFGQAEFRQVLLNTVLWVFLVPLVSSFLGLLYAVLVDGSRIEGPAKALIFLPMAISLVGASIIWRFVYEFRQASSEQVGLLNQILVWLGLDPYQFLITSPGNTFFLIAVMIWIQTGFAMTILSAAIKAIPDDIVEAARLDGASGTQMFFRVTIPSIRPALVVVLTTIAIGTLKVFDIVRTMTGGNFKTSVIANEFYTQAFGRFDNGVAAALAVILFVLVVPIVIYNVRQLRISEEVR